jgi:hypothetical protein
LGPYVTQITSLSTKCSVEWRHTTTGLRVRAIPDPGDSSTEDTGKSGARTWPKVTLKRSLLSLNTSYWNLAWWNPANAGHSSTVQASAPSQLQSTWQAKQEKCEAPPWHSACCSSLLWLPWGGWRLGSTLLPTPHMHQGCTEGWCSHNEPFVAGAGKVPRQVQNWLKKVWLGSKKGQVQASDLGCPIAGAGDVGAATDLFLVVLEGSVSII